MPIRKWNPQSVASLFCHVCLPITLGAAIYTLWRPKNLLVFSWYKLLGLQPSIYTFRNSEAGIRHLFPAFILYSLPDALWVYSFTFLILAIWRGKANQLGKLFWISVPAILGCGTELAQFFRLIQGSFDLADMVGYITAWAAAMAIFSYIHGRNHLENRA